MSRTVRCSVADLRVGYEMPDMTRNDATSHVTVERWVERFILTTALAEKLEPPPPPTRWADAPTSLRIAAPGRPPEFEIVSRAPKRPRALEKSEARARIMHTFFHHELQAAELMGWALLAFADAPSEFRRGLLRIMRDEIRHAALYREQVEVLGHQVGDFPVRDWFWERLPACETPLSYVASMGIGFEGGNLDHSLRFAQAFRAVGDEAGARAQEQVGREEVAHVRFALKWFQSFAGEFDFDSWTREIVAPLSPMVMRGSPLNVADRQAAGLDQAFVDRLKAWTPTAAPPAARHSEP